MVKIMVMKKIAKKRELRVDAEAVEKREIAEDVKAYRRACRLDRGKPVVTIEQLGRRLGLR